MLLVYVYALTILAEVCICVAHDIIVGRKHQ